MIRSVRVRRISLALLLPTALAAAPAALHTHLTRSEPAGMSTVRTAPTEIRLWFSAPIQINVTTVRLTGPDGAAVEVAAPANGDGANPPVVALVRGQLKPGRQQVTWRTMSRDGHAVSGTFAFTLAPAGASAAPASH
jgi:copper resistance protein C